MPQGLFPIYVMFNRNDKQKVTLDGGRFQCSKHWWLKIGPNRHHTCLHTEMHERDSDLLLNPTAQTAGACAVVFQFTIGRKASNGETRWCEVHVIFMSVLTKCTAHNI